MKALIIYNSKTGFTQRYASWIQEETGFEMVEAKKSTKKLLEDYDLLIFGGGIRAGKIGGYKKFLSKVPATSKLVIFATGATPNEAKDTLETMWGSNFSKEELEAIPHFYFQAGLDIEKMNWMERLIMKAVGKMLAKKQDKTPEEQAFAEALNSSYDISSKDFIEPLLEKLRK